MHFAPWYRREDYALLREIMDHGSLSLSMSGREMPSANARQQKREGTITVPVFIGPDEFFSFCMRRKIPLNKTTRPEFANSRGAASYSMGM